MLSTLYSVLRKQGRFTTNHKPFNAKQFPKHYYSATTMSVTQNKDETAGHQTLYSDGKTHLTPNLILYEINSDFILMMEGL